MLSTIGKAAIRRVGGSQSAVKRVVQFQRVCGCQSQVLFGQWNTTNASNAFARPNRSYATEIKTKTKPAAKKPAAKSTAAKKTATKKVVAKTKPKKTVKKKVAKKPVKKELTERQKALVVKAKQNAQLKKLKDAALLDPPTKLPTSAWQAYFQEYLATKKSGIGKNGLSLATIMKEAGVNFKTLDASSREHYNHIANQNKTRYLSEYTAWVESHTPEQIRLANLARSALKRRIGKAASHGKYYPIKDTRIPKKPSAPHINFLTERYHSGDFAGISFVDASKTAMAEYKALSAADKKGYEDSAAADQRRYEEEFKTVFGRDVPPKRVRKSAA